jgi:hypothetical protein
MHLGVAHHPALADLAPPASNCGFTSAIIRPPGRTNPIAASRTLASAMKLASHTSMSMARDLHRGQMPGIGLLQHHHPRVLPQLPGELVRPLSTA